MNKELEALEILYSDAKLDRDRIEKGGVLTYAEEIEHNERIKPYYDTIKQALIKAEKEHKALEILKRNVKVSIDYGVEKKDISCALVFYIDNKKTIYVVDEAIKEQNFEHFKALELLKEVLE